MYSYSQPYLLVQVRVQFPHSIVFIQPIKSLLVLVFARASGNAVCPGTEDAVLPTEASNKISYITGENYIGSFIRQKYFCLPTRIAVLPTEASNKISGGCQSPSR
jgi:hypothetical protein